MRLYLILNLTGRAGGIRTRPEQILSLVPPASGLLLHIYKAVKKYLKVGLEPTEFVLQTNCEPITLIFLKNFAVTAFNY